MRLTLLAGGACSTGVNKPCALAKCGVGMELELDKVGASRHVGEQAETPGS